MMRFNFTLSSIAVAALLIAMPAAEVHAQRIGIGIGLGGGRGGISIGGGRGGISIGSGGYGYGNNRNNGYYNQPSRQNYVQPNYVQPQTIQPQYPAAPPYQGPGVTVQNPSDQTLNFTIDNTRPMQVKPGEALRLSDSGKFQIAFDRGGQFGQARYTIHEGVYDFTVTEQGWELYRQRVDAAANIASGNQAAGPPAEVLPAPNGTQPPAAVSPPAVTPTPADSNPLLELSGQ